VVDHAVTDVLHYAGDLVLPSLVLAEMIRERCFKVRGSDVDELSSQQIMLRASKALKAGGLRSCGRSRRKRGVNDRVLYYYWSKAETPLHDESLVYCLRLLLKAIDIPMFQGSAEVVERWLEGKAPDD